jgi:hypothetical protein
MRRPLAAAILVLAACSSGSHAPTAPAPAPTPVGLASADLRVNAQKSGTFECSGGLFFVASILNQTSAAVRVDSLTLTFTRVSGADCADHAAPVSAAVGMAAPPGLSTEIRRVDLAGDLCDAPFGAPGCEWLGKATLATSFGTLADEIGFRTGGPALAVPGRPAPSPTPSPTTCGRDHPTVLTPSDGQTLSGVVVVSARLPPDDSPCPITLRANVVAARVGGGGGGFSTFLDLGDTYRWNTAGGPNGRYRITAQKACGTRACGGTSDPIEVTVSNR